MLYLLHEDPQMTRYTNLPAGTRINYTGDMANQPSDDLHTTAPISDGFTDQRDEDAADQDYCDRAIA
jgi:hypothetical protein